MSNTTVDAVETTEIENVETNNNPEPSPGEGNKNIENKEDDKENKSEPYHKNPRFQELVRKNREKDIRLAEMQKELDGYRVKQTPKSGDPYDSTDEFDATVASYFKGVPKPKLKEQYADVNELYAAFEANIFKRFKLAEQAEKSRQSEQEHQSQEQISNELNDFKDEIGEEEYINTFKPFAKKILDKAEELKKTITVESLITAYLSRDVADDIKSNVDKKSPGKFVSGSNKKGGSKPVGLTAKDISRMDMSELARVPLEE